MKRLYILYDSACGFCRRGRTWLGQQPAFVPLTFIPLQSAEVACRFPGIDRLRPEKEIVVISDSGEVWQGAAAWVMCLWALREYREWSLRLAHPALLPFARKACAFVSEHRRGLSRWVSSEGTEELRQRFAALPEDTGNEGYCKPR